MSSLILLNSGPEEGTLNSERSEGEDEEQIERQR